MVCIWNTCSDPLCRCHRRGGAVLVISPGPSYFGICNTLLRACPGLSLMAGIKVAGSMPSSEASDGALYYQVFAEERHHSPSSTEPSQVQIIGSVPSISAADAPGKCRDTKGSCVYLMHVGGMCICCHACLCLLYPSTVSLFKRLMVQGPCDV